MKIHFFIVRLLKLISENILDVIISTYNIKIIKVTLFSTSLREHKRLEVQSAFLVDLLNTRYMHIRVYMHARMRHYLQEKYYFCRV